MIWRASGEVDAAVEMDMIRRHRTPQPSRSSVEERARIQIKRLCGGVRRCADFLEL
jgi:hypothetical protein